MGAGYKGDQSNNSNLHLWELGSNMAAPVPRLTVFIRKPSLLGTSASCGGQPLSGVVTKQHTKVGEECRTHISSSVNFSL